MLNTVYKLIKHRPYWLLLAASALTLEIIALYFQYGMDLQPCVMCIYQRIAVLGVMAAAIIGAIAPRNAIFRNLGLIASAVAAGMGAKIAIEHVTIQRNTNPFEFFTCESQPNLPSWFSLDEWLPSVFEATGDCNTINWELLGFSMPEWMVIIFAGYLLVALVALMSQFRHRHIH